eukprot:gene502-795_t
MSTSPNAKVKKKDEATGSDPRLEPKWWQGIYGLIQKLRKIRVTK